MKPMKATPTEIKFHGRRYVRTTAALRHPITISRTDANLAYQQTRKEIDKTLTALKAELDKHATEQKTKPTHWGFQGDLSTVLGRLQDSLDFLRQEE
jgi:hypothetical protein